MTPQQFSSLNQVQLIDVRLPDDFDAAHLEGAISNCVFEVAFNDRLSKTAPDPQVTTVVYGANGASHEAEMALEKLHREGYSDAHILDGGIEQAEADGLPLVKGKPIAPIPAISDGDHAIDLEESRVEWLGKNLLNKHFGTAAIRSGTLSFEHGRLSGGEISIDMTRLTCTDLAGTDLHDVLISHLENDDFFDAANYPEARFVITHSEPTEGPSDGAPNLRISADLSLRGQTHPIEFTAVTGVTAEGKAAAQAAFSIDRTRWGVLYGSGKLFHRLAGHLVNDEIEFQIRILTR